MSLQKYKADYRAILKNVAEVLEAPVRPMQFVWDVERILLNHVRRVGRAGFGDTEPIVWVEDAQPGHSLAVGIQLYRLEIEGERITLARVLVPNRLDVPSFWAIPRAHYRRIYRFIRKVIRQTNASNVEPFMDQEDRAQLWNNTIGFLRRDHAGLKQFDVPLRRGVLLIGEPGNGKTMACRWLASQCQRFGLGFTTVTTDDFEAARRDDCLHEMFQPSEPGIVQFDDLDTALRDRRTNDNTREQSAFLAEMDGINSRTGVVYLFTSNLRFDELDPAMRRPGRIDTVIRFPKPDAECRERFIRDRWQAELLSPLDLSLVVAETDGKSYAEIEELRKLVALRFLDCGEVDWSWAQETFAGRSSEVARRSIGFVPAQAGEETATGVTVARGD